MSKSQFEVTTAALRATAASFGDRGEGATQIGAKAKSADVDPRAWGAVGLGLGLYTGYTAARDSADRSIAQVSSFLADAASALQATARDYDDADQAGGQLFTGIHDGLDK